MTVSLAVILLETTGNYQLGLPLMLTLITARFVGNFLGEGIYDLHVSFTNRERAGGGGVGGSLFYLYYSNELQISLRGWPFLPEHLPKSLTNRLRVRDVMTKGPRTLEEIVRVGEVVDLLQMTSHNAFPVSHS